MPTINPAEIVRTRTGGILKSNILLCYEILLSSENCGECIAGNELWQYDADKPPVRRIFPRYGILFRPPSTGLGRDIGHPVPHADLSLLRPVPL